MVKKKSPLEPPVRRKRAYELPNMVSLQVPQDPIRQIEREALADLSSEYRQLRVEEMIAKKRRQLNSNEPASNIRMQKENLELIKTAMELAKMNQPPGQKDNTLEYIKIFKDLYFDLQKNMGSGAQPSFFDQYVKARELGIVAQPTTGNSNVSDVEIEKLRGERMLSGKKIDLELHKLRLQAEMDRDKVGMIAGILGPIAAYGGGKMAENARQMGLDTANRYRSQGRPSPEAEILGSLLGKTAEMRIACPCGYDKLMIVPVPPPAQISCPGCGSLLTTGASTVSDEEAAELWK